MDRQIERAENERKVRAIDLCAVTIGGWVRDIILGDVIVVGPPGPDGEETPCPDQLIAIVDEWGWLKP